MNDAPPPPSGSGQIRPFPRIKEFIMVYANGVGDDNRSAQTFCDCESNEAIESLRRELTSIAAGSYNQESLDLIVGRGRTTKHGSYDNWAKLVLMWIASYRKGQG